MKSASAALTIGGASSAWKGAIFRPSQSASLSKGTAFCAWALVATVQTSARAARTRIGGQEKLIRGVRAGIRYAAAYRAYTARIPLSAPEERCRHRRALEWVNPPRRRPV